MYIYMKIVYKGVPMNSKLKGNPLMDYHSIQGGFEILKITETGIQKSCIRQQNGILFSEILT